MHISGKIFMFLVIIAAAVAAVFSAKIVHVRNSWMKKANDAQTTLEKNQTELAALTKTRNELRAEVARQELGWNRTWDGVNIQPSRQGGGRLSAQGVGLNQKMKPAVVYVFQSDGAGAKLVGSFRAEPEDNATPLIPTFKTRPTKLPGWQGGGAGWRIRQAIPYPSISRFTDLMGDLQKLDEDLIYRQRNIQTQQKLATDAKLKLDKRLNELNGEPDNNANAENLPGWMVDGLVKAIQDEEEERNAVLADVDALRRVVKKTYDQIQKVIAQNVARTQSLPGTVSTQISPNDVGLLETKSK